MPYNNTPIDPAEDVPGTTHLPMSRVKKILAVDDDINQVSNHAVFLCTRAAELFVRELAQRAFQTDRNRWNKPKKSLQYNDIAYLVHRTDRLEFLSDIIPEVTTYGKHKRDKKQKDEALAEKKAKKANLAQGQTTLAMPGMPAQQGPPGHVEPVSRPGTATAAPTLGSMLNDPLPEVHANGSKDIRFKHYEPKIPNGTPSRAENNDEMQMDGS